MPETQTIRTDLVAALYREVLPSKFAGMKAEVMLHAIALQESRYEHRQQIGGPARGFWQFERGGGVKGVLTHPVSRKYAQAVCALQGVQATEIDVYRVLATDDLLAVAFARLLLYTDPRPLPAIGDAETAFDYYLRNWRPGAYHNGSDAQKADLRAKWGRNYAEAVEACQ